MEDFFYAGGLPALLRNLGDLLDTDAVTANGRTLGENIAGAKVFNDDVIRPRDNPLVASGHARRAARQPGPGRGGDQAAGRGGAGCTGTPGRRWCSTNYDDMAARIDDPDLVVDENSVLVLQSAGPQGAPGMPEWGQLPIPKKLLEKGVRDMVRISDARMSGTSYGACVLHVAPESFVGGPLALVRDGDVIELDVAGPPALPQRQRRGAGEAPGRLAAARRRSSAAATARCTCKHITQANEGCDFDFLEAGPPTPEPEIH